MSHRVRLILIAVLLAVVAGARAIAPPAPTASFAFGRGSTIVLLHGLGSRPEHWLPAARLLARRHHVVLVDLPGHGVSAMPEPFSLERASQSLDRTLARETPPPCILVGHSVGGLVAAAEALAHPERVRGLVLIETALKPQIDGADRDTLLAQLDRDYQGVLASAYRAFGRDSAQGEKLYREVAAMDPAMIKPWIRLAVTCDLSRRMGHLNVPLLVVLAPRSWPAGEPWRVTAAALGYDPRVRAERIEGCGHFVMLDQPAALARMIERFAADPAANLVALR